MQHLVKTVMDLRGKSCFSFEMSLFFPLISRLITQPHIMIHSAFQTFCWREFFNSSFTEFKATTDGKMWQQSSAPLGSAATWLGLGLPGLLSAAPPSACGRSNAGHTNGHSKSSTKSRSKEAGWYFFLKNQRGEEQFSYCSFKSNDRFWNSPLSRKGSLLRPFCGT